MKKTEFWNTESFPVEHNSKPNTEIYYYSMDQPHNWEVKVSRDYLNTKFTYRFNKQGFRSENNFDDDYDYGFLIAGDSFVIGEGVPVEETWAYKLTKKISKNINIDLPHLSLGWPGASSKRITQNIITFIDNYKTNRVLAMYPIFERQLFYDKENNFLEDTQPNFPKYKKFYRIINEETFINFYIQDIYMAQLYCKNKNIQFNWTSWHFYIDDYISMFPDYLKSTYIKLDLLSYLPNDIKNQKARDGHHPGKAYQIAASNCFFNFYSHIIKSKKW